MNPLITTIGTSLAPLAIQTAAEAIHNRQSANLARQQSADLMKAQALGHAVNIIQLIIQAHVQGKAREQEIQIQHRMEIELTQRLALEIQHRVAHSQQLVVMHHNEPDPNNRLKLIEGIIQGYTLPYGSQGRGDGGR